MPNENMPDTIEPKPTNPGVREIRLDAPLLPDWPEYLNGATSWTPVAEARDAFRGAPDTVLKTKAEIEAIYSDVELTRLAKQKRSDSLLAIVEADLIGEKLRLDITRGKGQEAAASLETVVRSYAPDEFTESKLREQRAIFSACSETEQNDLVRSAIEGQSKADTFFLQSLVAGPRGFRHNIPPEILVRVTEQISKQLDPAMWSKAQTFGVAADHADESIRASVQYLNDWLTSTDEALEQIKLS